MRPITSLIELNAWSTFTTDITLEQRAVFGQALVELKNAHYVPIAVSKQVAMGICYKFICNKVVAPEHGNQAVLIYVNLPLAGEAHIYDVVQL